MVPPQFQHLFARKRSADPIRGRLQRARRRRHTQTHLRHFRDRAVHDLDRFRVKVARNELREERARLGRLFGRLEHDRVARSEGADERGEEEENRPVARPDDERDALRLVLHARGHRAEVEVERRTLRRGPVRDLLVRHADVGVRRREVDTVMRAGQAGDVRGRRGVNRPRVCGLEG